MWCRSYAQAVSEMKCVWDAIGNDILNLEWDDVYHVGVQSLAGIRCVAFLDYDGSTHTVPFPLNWEWA